MLAHNISTFLKFFANLRLFLNQGDPSYSKKRKTPKHPDYHRNNYSIFIFNSCSNDTNLCRLNNN